MLLNNTRASKKELRTLQKLFYNGQINSYHVLLSYIQRGNRDFGVGETPLLFLDVIRVLFREVVLGPSVVDFLKEFSTDNLTHRCGTQLNKETELYVEKLVPLDATLLDPQQIPVNSTNGYLKRESELFNGKENFPDIGKFASWYGSNSTYHLGKLVRGTNASDFVVLPIPVTENVTIVSDPTDGCRAIPMSVL